MTEPISGKISVSQSMSPIIKPASFQSPQTSGKITPGQDSLKIEKEGDTLVLHEFEGESPSPTGGMGEREINEAVKKANSSLEGLSSSLSFIQDEKTGKTITKLVDKESGNIIRQFPSKEMLEIARSLSETKNGIFLSEKV